MTLRPGRLYSVSDSMVDRSLWLMPAAPSLDIPSVVLQIQVGNVPDDKWR